MKKGDTSHVYLKAKNLAKRVLCLVLILQFFLLAPYGQTAQAQINPGQAERGVKYDIRFDVAGATPNNQVTINYSPGANANLQADENGAATTSNRIDYTEEFDVQVRTRIDETVIDEQGNNVRAQVDNELNIEWAMTAPGVHVWGKASRSASVKLTLGTQTQTIVADNNGNFDFPYVPVTENPTELVDNLQVNIINTYCSFGDCVPLNPAGFNIALNTAVNYDAVQVAPNVPAESGGQSSSGVMGALMTILSLLGLDLGDILRFVGDMTVFSSEQNSVQGITAQASIAVDDAQATVEATDDAADESAEVAEMHTPEPEEAKQVVAAEAAAESVVESREHYAGLAQILYERQVAMNNSRFKSQGFLPRAQYFLRNYCNANVYPSAQGQGFFAQTCGNVLEDRVDRDIKASFILGTPTLDVSYKSDDAGALPELSDDENDVLNFLQNVLSFQPPTYEDVRASSSGALNPSQLSKLLKYMKFNTLHSFARNSWANIVAFHAKGTKTVEELGIPELLQDYGIDMAQYTEYLGEKPSYYAQLEFASRVLYQDPEFYAGLGTPNLRSLEARRAMIKALRLQVDREIFRSMQRTEGMLVVLNELRQRELNR
ncbi:MAG: hypothetical protein GC136_02570 [Alphaproteobacteria bacterium]|nr:hypothetical protein [Alphaproteobacteria bacterium]